MRLSLLAIALIAVAALLLSTGHSPAHAAIVPIDVGDRWFCDPSFENRVCTTTVQAGDEVVWDFSPSSEAHTVTDCGVSCDNPTQNPLFDSGLVQGGGPPFAFTFADPGTYPYVCLLHVFEMRGEIVVQPGAAPTVTPAGGQGTTTPGSGGPTTAPAGTPSAVSAVPSAGQGSQREGGAWPWLAVLGGTGIALSGLGVGVRRFAK